jgi:hypothetical protein
VPEVPGRRAAGTGRRRESPRAVAGRANARRGGANETRATRPTGLAAPALPRRGFVPTAVLSSLDRYRSVMTRAGVEGASLGMCQAPEAGIFCRYTCEHAGSYLTGVRTPATITPASEAFLKSDRMVSCVRQPSVERSDDEPPHEPNPSAATVGRTARVSARVAGVLRLPHPLMFGV